MAKLFRFSGYLVNKDESYDADAIKCCLDKSLTTHVEDCLQQVHVEESAPTDDPNIFVENADLSYLARPFYDRSDDTFDRPEPKPGEKWRHFKTGHIIEIVGVGNHTESTESMVIYKCGGTLWVRPLSMFMSLVDKEKYPNAKQQYRFEHID